MTLMVCASGKTFVAVAQLLLRLLPFTIGSLRGKCEQIVTEMWKYRDRKNFQSSPV